MYSCGMSRLQNSRIFCERERQTLFERKAGASEKSSRENGERRFTLEDHAYGLPAFRKRLFCSLWNVMYGYVGLCIAVDCHI